MPAFKSRVLWKTPGPQPNGLQATADGLWVIDQKDDKIYLLDYVDGSVKETIQTRCKHSSGITLDDAGGIWVASTWTFELVRYDRRTGQETNAFKTPPYDGKNGVHGLEWRDGAIWFNAPKTGRIYRADPNTGSIYGSISSHGDRAHGMAWDGNTLWCVDTNRCVIFQLDPETGLILDAVGVSQPEPHGMTRWQGKFWLCDATSREVFILER